MALIKEIYLAGGCFWGMQKYLKLINGVTDTVVGFANGNTESPSYKEVYTDATGHAETVKVKYDPNILRLEDLVRFFFKAIDPLSLNKQGEDQGTRYRTGVYYVDESEKEVIRSIFDEVSTGIGEDVVVECCPMKCFFPAEEYHQDYLDKNPNGYCHLTPELFEISKTINR